MLPRKILDMAMLFITYHIQEFLLLDKISVLLITVVDVSYAHKTRNSLSNEKYILEMLLTRFLVIFLDANM